MDHELEQPPSQGKNVIIQKESYEKTRKDEIFDMMTNMSDIQQEIKEYKNMKKFAVMKEN